eukprot:3317653-Amphidinium_carterae.1
MAVTMCIDGAATVMRFSSPLRDKSSEIVAQHMVHPHQPQQQVEGEQPSLHRLRHRLHRHLCR